ncbi:uncharacterized protein Dmul_07040 [Desulfococcus multivorans]|nr:uncharacterized protein Dmul_07040 [Desulfococcus multivorans]
MIHGCKKFSATARRIGVTITKRSGGAGNDGTTRQMKRKKRDNKERPKAQAPAPRHLPLSSDVCRIH